MSEQLTFYQFRWNSGTVDFNESFIMPVAFFVQLMGDKFFPASIGTCNQYPCIRWSYFVNQGTDVVKGF